MRLQLATLLEGLQQPREMQIFGSCNLASHLSLVKHRFAHCGLDVFRLITSAHRTVVEVALVSAGHRCADRLVYLCTVHQRHGNWMNNKAVMVQIGFTTWH
jgi:hypothetical protein